MLRSFISKTIFPNFERDLAKTLQKEVKTMDDAMGCMLAPQVHSYQAATTGGAFGASSARSAPQRLIRVARPIKKDNGLFHE